MANNVLERANQLHEKMIEYRRTLHRNPELGLQLPATVAFVRAQLEAMGYQPVECGECGLLATVGGKKPGKVFLIRADMDALPVVEETDLAYKSTNDNMHACGHDMHTAMLLGAAEILKEMEDDIEGTIKLMFQPGEEILAGAKSMVAAGVLENPSVDRAMMIHVGAGFPLPTGTLLVPGGDARMAASDWFEIQIKGKGGHGAMPHLSVDPINVAVHIHMGLQEINSREMNPADNMALTVGYIQAGTTSNVLPDTAVMKGTIRTFLPETREMVKTRIAEISAGIAGAFRAEATTLITDGCPSLASDDALAKASVGYLTDELGPTRVVDGSKLSDIRRVTGSEDFSFVTEKVPSVMMMLVAGNAQEGYIYPQHHPKVRFDEAALPFGAAAYATVPFRWLQDNK